MKKILSLVTMSLIALSMFSMLASQTQAEPDQGTWVRKADMPTPRRDPAAVAYNGKIYVIGGINVSGGDFIWCSIIEIYDPITDSWTTGTPMPDPKGGSGAAGIGAVVINNKIYVVGGDNRTFSYDPETDQWNDTLAEMPVDFVGGDFGLGVVDGKMYVAKGGQFYPSGEYWTYCYDPLTDKWTELSPLPYHHHIQSFAELGGKLYGIGGQDPSEAPPAETNRVDIYDPKTDSWELDAIPRMLYRRGDLEPVTPVINSRIYVMGGWNGYSALSEAEVYDSSTNTWTELAPMPTRRWSLATAVVNGKIYAIGGNQYRYNLQSVNEEFTPPGWTPPPSKKLLVDAHGEIDYFPWERVNVKVAALVSDMETMELVSDADVSIKIYDPDDNLWISTMMTEKLSPGIYVWESNETVRQIFWQGGKGVYTVLVEASYQDGPTASDILVFHIDPPPPSPPMIVKIAPPLVAIAAIAAIALIYFKKKRKS